VRPPGGDCDGARSAAGRGAGVPFEAADGAGGRPADGRAEVGRTGDPGADERGGGADGRWVEDGEAGAPGRTGGCPLGADDGPAACGADGWLVEGWVVADSAAGAIDAAL
jgi:hypothetical protein